jgi:hypothetical protein
MAIRIGDCHLDQLEALKRFWARTYRPDYVLCRDETLLKWQFRGPGDREGNAAFNVKLALLDEEVVGSLGYIPVEVSLKGSHVRGAWLANWMVADSHRRLGLGPLLIRELSRQFDALLNGGPNEDARSVLSRMDWINLGPLRRYLAVLDTDVAAGLLQLPRLSWPAPVSGRGGSALGVSVGSVSRFDLESTRMWDAFCSQLGAGTRRSAEYLNWRYVDHPVWQYRCFEARSGAELTGIAVYRVEQVRDQPTRVGRIVELIGDEPSGAALIDAIVSDARHERVAVVDFFCSSPHVSQAMSSSGFLPDEHPIAAGFPMLFQPLDRRRTAIHFMARLAVPRAAVDIPLWYVTKSDADQDRPN